MLNKRLLVFFMVGFFGVFTVYFGYHRMRSPTSSPMIVEKFDLPPQSHPTRNLLPPPTLSRDGLKGPSEVKMKQNRVLGNSHENQVQEKGQEKVKDVSPTGALEIKERLGSVVEIKFNEEGYISSVQGKMIKDQTVYQQNFRTDNPETVEKRANEIIESIRFELGIQEHTPLGKPRFNLGPHSAQVFFQETYFGYPILPFGSVKISLGPKGELLQLESSYVRELVLTNEIRLSSEEAFAKAKNEIFNGKLSPENKVGRTVVWAPMSISEGQETKGHFAFEYFSSGFQIILNASDGTVLAKIPRRSN